MPTLAERMDEFGPQSGYVVIDLGEDRDPLDVPPPRTGRGWTSIIVVVLLLLYGTVASAAPGAGGLRELPDVELSLADTYAVTAESVLLVHSPHRAVLAAYDLADGDLRWRVAAPAVSYRLRFGGGLVLLRQRAGSQEMETTALSMDRGATRWRTTDTVVAIAGSPTVLAVSELRTVSGTGRRVQGTVVGVDPVSGSSRWTLQLIAPAMLQAVPGTPTRALFVYDDGNTELRDLGTGATVAAAKLPFASYSTTNPSVIGHAIVLRHPSEDGDRITAYDLETLGLRWSMRASLAYDAQVCGYLACLVGRFGVRAVDPVNGVERWAHRDWRQVEQRGDVLLAYGDGGDGTSLVGVADPADGRLLADLRRWDTVPSSGLTGPVLVARDQAGDDPTLVGVVTGANPAPRLIGQLPRGAGDCRSTAARLVCRADGRVLIWRF